MAIKEKEQYLKKLNSLNPHPQKVQDETFKTNEFFDARDLVQVKYEMLRRVQQKEMSVTQASAHFGFTRPVFYQSLAAFEREGILGLSPQKTGPKKARKLTETVLNYIKTLQNEEKANNSSQLANAVRQQFGLQVHPRSIERALIRNEKKKITEK